MDPPTFSSIDVNSLINNNDNVSSESSAVKRKRLTQACDACRKKKVKCSGEKPSCNNCTRLGTHCTYLPSTRKRGPRVGLVESLEKRLQQMEKLLQPLKEQRLSEDDDKQTGYPTKKPRLNSRDSEDTLDIPFSRFVPPNFPNQNQFQQSSATFNKQNGSSYAQNDYSQLRTQNEKSTEHLIHHNHNVNKDKQVTGKEEDELIYFGKTSVRPGFRHQWELCGNVMPDSPTISEGSSSSVNSEEITTIVPTILPNPRPIVVSDYLPIDVVEHLASCFFRYVDVQMSMFHEVTFMRHLRQNKVSALLVFAMCASSARYATHPSVVRNPPYMSGEPFATAANKMLLQSFDFPSVEHVQAYILLALHMFGTCRGPRAWMYIGMAVRMAQEIGLHKIDEVPLGSQPPKVKSEAVFIQKETRRRTFWSCFLLDRYSACAVGRPTLIEEDDCDVRLPCNEAIWNYDHPFSKSLIEKHFNEHQVKHDSRISLAHEGLCACFVSVTALLGRVTQFVNRSKPSNSPPPWDPQSQFTILSKELEMWYNKLMPHYAYGKDRLQKLVVNGTGVMFATFHLLYHATVIVLNRPNIAILQNNEVMDPHVAFMRASAKRCSEAAKMVVSISSDILQHGNQCLCPFTVYPIFVSTTILINDLHSLDNSVAQEARMNLEMVEKYLKTMSPYWAMADKFNCMINEMRKAREEQSECEKDESTNIFRSTERSERRNSEQMGDTSDAGLLAYWNRTNAVGNTNSGSTLDEITSIILPEEFSSPRWLGSAFNDPSMTNDNTWTNFLRSPGPLTPRSISRIVKKDKNSNEEDSNENDYFSQDVTYNYPPPVFDGYPGMLDMSLLNNQTNFDWGLKDTLLVTRPSKHWSTITSMNEESSANDTESMPSANTNISN